MIDFSCVNVCNSHIMNILHSLCDLICKHLKLCYNFALLFNKKEKEKKKPKSENQKNKKLFQNYCRVPAVLGCPALKNEEVDQMNGGKQSKVY